MKIKLLISSVLLAISAIGFSQLPGGLPGGGGDPDTEDPDAGVPIDNGIIVLVVLGAGLGIKKLIRKK